MERLTFSSSTCSFPELTVFKLLDWVTGNSGKYPDVRSFLLNAKTFGSLSVAVAAGFSFPSNVVICSKFGKINPSFNCTNR